MRQRLLSVGHAESSYAAAGDPLGCVGELARAVLEEAHARLAAAGRWVLNEKRMVSDAGLDAVRPVFASVGRTAAELAEAADVVRAVITGQGEARILQRSPPRRCITVARTTARE